MIDYAGTPYMLVTLHRPHLYERTHSYIKLPEKWEEGDTFDGPYWHLIGKILDHVGYTGANEAPLILNASTTDGNDSDYMYFNTPDFAQFSRELWYRWGANGTVESPPSGHTFYFLWGPEYAPLWRTPEHKHYVAVALNITDRADFFTTF
jgi:hypothetical protein